MGLGRRHEKVDVRMNPGDIVYAKSTVNEPRLSDTLGPRMQFIGLLLKNEMALVVSRYDQIHTRNTLLLTSRGLLGWAWGEDLVRLT